MDFHTKFLGMKRSADSLEEYAIKIVNKASTRDANQNLVYADLWEDPAILPFITARDALLEVIRDKPIRFLRLLETSKGLNKLFAQFPGVWRVMSARLIEMELGGYMAQVYPFFIVENARFRAQRAFSTRHLMFANREKYMIALDGNLVIKPALGIRISEMSIKHPVLQGDKSNEYYYYVKYDAYTHRFITVMQYLKASYNAGFSFMFIDRISRIVSEFLGIRPLGGFLACYLDGFLVTPEYINEKDGTAKFTHPTNMTDFLEGVISFAQEYTYRKGTTDFGTPIVNVFRYDTKVATLHQETPPDLVGDLRALLDAPVPENNPNATRLDAKSMSEFSTKLAEMYPGGQEGEKRLFKNLLYSFVGDGNNATRIDKYSSNYPLKCIACHSLTSLVDPHLELAFCRTECLALYKK